MTTWRKLWSICSLIVHVLLLDGLHLVLFGMVMPQSIGKLFWPKTTSLILSLWKSSWLLRGAYGIKGMIWSSMKKLLV
jgi:hypothetical protein